MMEGPRPEESFERLVERTEGLQPWRRVMHVLSGAGAAWIVWTLSPESAWTRWLFGVAFAGCLGADLLRLRWKAVNRQSFRMFGPLMTPREVEGTTGVPWFLLGVFAVLWLPGAAVLAIPSILVLGFADPAAGTVGRLFGRRRLGKGTLEGALAFFVTAFAVLVPFVGVGIALPVAAFVASMEVLPSGLNDNFVIPVATGLSLWAFSGLG